MLVASMKHLHRRSQGNIMAVAGDIPLKVEDIGRNSSYKDPIYCQLTILITPFSLGMHTCAISLTFSQSDGSVGSAPLDLLFHHAGISSSTENDLPVDLSRCPNR